MKNKTAIIMVGLPGAGKSTLRNKILADNNVNINNCMILSTDDYIDNYAKNNDKTYNDVFKDVIKEAEKNLYCNLQNAIDQENDILWDQTNLSKSKRKKVLDKIPDDYKVIAVEINTSFDDIVNRVKHRFELTGKNIPYTILKSMYDSKESVSNDEGFDETYIIDN